MKRSAADFMPPKPSLDAMREAARSCRGCELYRDATQTVFGEGDVGADVMFVGEQPGDREDLAGNPFVGPAGRELDRALEEAGIDREQVYVTNVVKHFKWEPRGKRRIHKRPSAEEISACRPWLDGELEQVRPKVVVALGATAAQALLGRTYRLTQQRGTFVPGPNGTIATATVHPSSILRAPDDDSRHRERRRFVADLIEIANFIQGRSAGPARLASSAS